MIVGMEKPLEADCQSAAVVKEHLCTVAVDITMGEEHADGECRLDVIGQVQEGLVGTSHKYFAVVLLFGLLWLVMRRYDAPPPSGVSSLKTSTE